MLCYDFKMVKQKEKFPQNASVDNKNSLHAHTCSGVVKTAAREVVCSPSYRPIASHRLGSRSTHL